MAPRQQSPRDSCPQGDTAVVQQKVEATSASQDRDPAAASGAAGPEVKEAGCAAPSPPAASESVAPAEMDQRIEV